MESSDLAAALGMSVRTLERKFKEWGTTPHQWIIARTTSYGAVSSHIHDHAHRFDCPCRRFFGYRPYETSFSPAFRHDAPPIPTPKRTEPFGGFLRKPTKTAHSVNSPRKRLVLKPSDSPSSFSPSHAATMNRGTHRHQHRRIQDPPCEAGQDNAA